jgi:cell division septation protein DedD
MIKKILALGLLAALFMGLSIASPFAVGLEAAPPQQGAVITSPQDRDVVRGLLVIKGTATHPNFWKYEVYFAPEPNPNDQWQLLGLHEMQVTDGRLETWDTSLVPDGTYSLRLRVVRADGNYDEYYVRQISVVNAQPTETPTATPTPVATRTPLPPTPTVIIEQPPTSTPRPTSTPGPVEVTPEPQTGSGLNITVQGLSKAFLYGAGGTMGLFLLMGILIVLRRLISWLIAQF